MMKHSGQDWKQRGTCASHTVLWSNVTMEKCCRYIDQLNKVIPKIIEVNEEATGFEVNSLFLYYACAY